MKILSVRFKNLNSLVGEWLIDFNHPEYQDEGIFAITGPTGVGKSTLLDAICLALYGRTPRLSTISANNNEIMSRHTSECMAEVCFQNKKGTFRAYWYQHRANHNAVGVLQTAKREITNHLTGQLLADSIKQAQENIVELTGMDFDRFTRSMLLAQGSFAAFLQANVNDRSALLEQINGTQIYSQISQKVFEINKQHKDELNQQETAIAAYHLLSSEALQELLNEEANKKIQQKEVKQTIDSHLVAITWLKQINKLENELLEAKNKQQEILSRIEQSKPEQVQVHNANKAIQLEADYALLLNNQKSLLATEQKIKEFTSQLPSLKQQIELAVTQTKNTTDKVETLRQAHDNLIELLKKVRALDTLIDERRKALKAENDALNQNQNQHKKIKHDLLKNQEQFEALLKKLKNNSEAISTHQNIRGLTSDLPLLSNLINSTSAGGFDIQNKNIAIDIEKNSIISKTQTFKSESDNLERLRKEKKQTQENLNRITEGLSTLLGTNELTDLHQEGKVIQNTLHELSSLKNEAVVYRDLQLTQKDNCKNVNQIQDQQEHFKSQKNQKEIELHHLETNQTLLEKEYLLKKSIASLSELRAQLEEGQACALCGSLNHPYASGLAPQVDESQQQLTEVKKQITTTQEELKQIEIGLAKNSHELKLLKDSIQTQEENLADKNNSLAQNLTRYFSHTLLSDNEEQLNLVITAIDKKIAQTTSKQHELEAQINQVDQLEKDQRSKQISIAELERKLNTQVLLTTQLTTELEQHNIDLTRLQSEKATLDQEYTHVFNQLANDLTKLGITECDLKTKQSCDAIIQELEAKLLFWNQLQTAQLNLDNQITSLDATIQSQNEQVKNQVEQLAVLQSHYENKNAEFNQSIKNRNDLFGNKNTDVEEQLSQDQLRQTEESFKKQIDQLTQLKQDRQNLEVQITETTNTLEDLSHKNNQLNQLFQSKYKNLGFMSTEEYLAACLDNSERERLTLKIQQLNTEQVAIETTLQNLAKNINLEKNKNLSQETIETLQSRLDNFNEQLLKNENELGFINAKLLDHQQQNDKVSALQKQLNLQRADAQKWSNLNSLIGSSDGKLYRNFVQSITFEILIQFANQQLQKISDRYLLVQLVEAPLELKVIDSYQANEMRSTQNLSGGETFLISLSLALGLSKMASDTVSVDTLFLDEGFGTLDEDTLDTALNTLSSLQNEGKLIGIISHVAALKERIHTQIKVSPLRYGQSKIEGPGCSKK